MRLTLFMTKGMTLRKWDEVGIFDRELAIYRQLQQLGVEVTIVSYGGRDEHAYRERLGGIRLLTNWINWNEKRYEHRLHQLHGLRLWQSDVLKTNQMFGAEVAVRASRLWKKPLVLRMGYLWSHAAQEANPDKPIYLRQIEQIETEAISHASHIVVTTADIHERIVDRQPEVADKITRIPNYVDTDVFRPLDESKHYDLIHVGRISRQKNLPALLQAVDRAGVSIALIGDGDLYDDLKAQFAYLGERITWLGRVPNADVPVYINRARVYILSSYYEGHPKTLIEAMACGMPVIGTDVVGIQQVLVHGDNGYVCDIESESLQQAIEAVLADRDLMVNLGERARQFAIEHYALDKIAQTEFDLLRQISLN